MNNEKNKIEALLFSSGRRMNLEEISRLTKMNDMDLLKTLLQELKSDLETRGGSIILSDDGEYYKMTVKDHYIPIVKSVVKTTEIDRPLMETLSVIAWKYPILQADVVKIRHNKAYDHLRILEEMGFITRGMFGRTKKITLTQKFFEYFDLPSREMVMDVFKDVMTDDIKNRLSKLENDINEGEKIKEDVVKKQEELQKKKAEIEAKKKAKKENLSELKKEIELIQDKEEDEIQEIEKDIEEIKNVEEKDVYSAVPEVQEPDEVSNEESGSSEEK